MPRRRHALQAALWAALAAALLFAPGVCFAATPSNAPPTVSVGPSPVLNVFARRGRIIFRTWTRNQVQVQGDATIVHVSAQRVAKMLPTQIPARAQTLRTRDGDITLPPEEFVLPPLPAVPHDGIIVHGDGNVIIDMPATTALVVSHVGVGRIVLQNYHGAFYTMVRRGGIVLRNVSGTGFVQTLRGYFNATNSTFDRLRVRTGAAHAFFERCTSRQIVVSSIFGSIVYDNGSFVPGLAHFESQHGDVALGIGSGGAQIGAHSGTGRVATSFSSRVNVVNHAGDTSVSVGGGGATVTASSLSGAVLLYDGSLRLHPALLANLPRMRAILERRFRFRHAPVQRAVGSHVDHPTPRNHPRRPPRNHFPRP